MFTSTKAQEMGFAPEIRELYRKLLVAKYEFAAVHNIVYNQDDDRFEEKKTSRLTKFLHGKEDPRLLKLSLDFANEHRRKLNKKFHQALEERGVDQNTAIRVGRDIEQNFFPERRRFLHDAVIGGSLSILGLTGLKQVLKQTSYPEHSLGYEKQLSPGGSPRTIEDELNELKSFVQLSLKRIKERNNCQTSWFISTLNILPITDKLDQWIQSQTYS